MLDEIIDYVKFLQLQVKVILYLSLIILKINEMFFFCSYNNGSFVTSEFDITICTRVLGLCN